MDRLAGKTALITGGASGIGLGMARAFIAAGLRVAIADLNGNSLEAAAAALPGLGQAVKLDVRYAAEWEQAVDSVEAALGPLEILCNNAGVGQGRFADGRDTVVAEMPEALWRMVLETNATGTFLGARTVASRMIARGKGGHIVNTASTGGLMAPGGIAAYCASKFAVVGLSESMRAELAPAGIGVSVLCPGGVRSNLFASSVAIRAQTPDAFEGLATVGTDALRTEQAQRMDPVRVGEMVLRAIAGNAMYIIPHPEYLGHIEERHAALVAAFGESAQPGYRDTDVTFERFRNPEYARAPR
ncbi:MAG: SDR family oxidoreductase [Acetobacteraceae bacterium]|nr:SDR family oxidoreductase [Acetobacteraceae bacterium]